MAEENKKQNGNVNGNPAVTDDDEDFETGYTSFRNNMTKNREKFESYKLGGVFREFWLKHGTEAAVRFLTDEPVAIGRHAVYRNGKWTKYTCRGKSSEREENVDVCPMCAAGWDLRDEGAHLLIDRREFEGKDKKVYTNELKIMLLSSKHIVGFDDDRLETDEKTLKREWKMKRSGTDEKKPKYTIYPKPTKPIPDEEKKHYKAILAQFIESWEAFKKRTGKDKTPLERYVVMKCLARMPKDEMQKLVDEYEASKASTPGMAQPAKGSGESATKPSGEGEKPANYSDDDFTF